MKKALLIGASGFLGTKLKQRLEKDYEVLGTFLKNPENDLVKLDLADSDLIQKILEESGPDIIFHCGGITSTDYCEQNREEAYRVNVIGTREIVKSFNGKIVYFSTDYVFDGSEGRYSEEDVPNPLNYYGTTKLISENIVLSKEQNLVVRLSGLYGFNEINNKFMEHFKRKGTVSACPYLFSSPTFIDDVVSNLEALVEISGLLHLSSSEKMSRFELAERIISEFFPGKEIKKSTLEEAQKNSVRPRDSSLVCNPIFNTNSIEESIKIMKDQRKRIYK